MSLKKHELFELGKERIFKFCKINKMKPPDIVEVDFIKWKFGVTCAYWRDNTITICLAKCAHACTDLQVRNWNWPGNTVDRTPYGVLAHELGHHFDYHLSKAKGKYFGNFSKELRINSGERPLTGYCPDNAEWFAEMFRLFVTNPELLRDIRPRTYDLLTTKIDYIDQPWKRTLRGDCPSRIITACENKIEFMKKHNKRSVGINE